MRRLRTPQAPDLIKEQHDNVCYPDVLARGEKLGVNDALFRMMDLEMTSQKTKLISTFAIFKNNNSTIDPVSLGIYAPGPQFLIYRPEILRGVRI